MLNQEKSSLPEYLWIYVALCLAGATISEMVWFRDTGPFLLLVLFPLNGMAKDKIRRAALWFSYYLSGSSSMISAVQGFYPDLSFATEVGICLWLITSFTLALPWILIYPKCDESILRWSAKFSLAVLLIVLPPIGLWGWLFPFLFMAQAAPGYGLLGLVTGVIIAGAIVRASFLNERFGAFMVSMIVLLYLVLAPLPIHQKPTDIVAADTYLSGWPSDNQMMTRRQIDLLNLMMDFNDALPSNVKHVVMPEGVAGPWVQGMNEFWGQFGTELARRSGRTFYMGSEILSDDKDRRGSLVAISASGISETATAMQPMPISSWHPWQKGSTEMHWDKTNVARIGENDYAIIFCYEEIGVISFIKPFFYLKPQGILAIANSWWSTNSGAAAMQERHTMAWASLYGVPYLRSTNR